MRPCTSAKADYAVRAAIELAAAEAGPVKGDRIAEAQQTPLKLLENILSDLRHAGYVQSQRGAEHHGYCWPGRPRRSPWPTSSGRGRTLAVRGAWPESVEYSGSASRLVEVWIAVRVSLRSVLGAGHCWPTWSPGSFRPASALVAGAGACVAVGWRPTSRRRGPAAASR